MTETKIYVGLNDSETLEQKQDTDVFVSVLRHVCRSYSVAVSYGVVHGSYIHEDGRYTDENTLVLSLIDADEKVIDEIAKDLCVFFHQESVLITKDEVRAYYIKESL